MGITALFKEAQCGYNIYMKTNKTISLFLISAFVVSAAGSFAFAGNSLTFNMLQEANGIPNYDNAAKNSGNPSPVVPGLNAENTSAATSAAVTKSSTTVPAVTPPEPVPPKTTVLGIMGTDLNKKKTDYAIAGLTGALTAFFLAGCVLWPAVLIGFGVIVVFLLLLRNVNKPS